MPTGKRGLPPLDPNDPSVAVSVKMSAKQYDLLYARAQHERVSVPEQIRREVRQEAEKGKD